VVGALLAQLRVSTASAIDLAADLVRLTNGCVMRWSALRRALEWAVGSRRPDRHPAGEDVVIGECNPGKPEIAFLRPACPV
jgi:hypothetical protein